MNDASPDRPMHINDWIRIGYLGDMPGIATLTELSVTRHPGRHANRNLLNPSPSSTGSLVGEGRRAWRAKRGLVSTWVRGSFTNSRDDRVRKRFRFHVQHRHSRSERGRNPSALSLASLGAVIFAIGMLNSVYFDNQLVLHANKVSNVATNGNLAFELDFHQPSTSQLLPQKRFSVCCIGCMRRALVRCTGITLVCGMTNSIMNCSG